MANNVFSVTLGPFLFIMGNIILLLIVLILNKRTKSRPVKSETPVQKFPCQDILDPTDILGREFEYARITASEAMQDRYTMVNFYLLAAGVVTSGVLAIVAQQANFPKSAGTVLLWLLCGIGWFYFLKLIRLRQAWHESAQAMNQIKEFYIQHVKGIDPNVMSSAFRWQFDTLPNPDKPWTVFFYSAALIGFLDSVAFMVGGSLLILDKGPVSTLNIPWLLIVYGLIFFAFHVWLYFEFLKSPGKKGKSNPKK